jgi:hypothetical protein
MIEIRSYRRVFDLERRIYRVDRLRLNPAGVPVRGVMYFLVLLASCLIAGRVPLAGLLVRALPWYLRDLALPGGCAAVLSVIRVEGRPFHVAAKSLLRYAAGHRSLAGARRCAAVGRCWRAEEIVFLPDGSDSRMRRLRYSGPGAVLVAIEHERAGRLLESGGTGVARRGARRVLSLRELPRASVLSRGEVISLGRGARLLVRPKARETGPTR